MTDTTFPARPFARLLPLAEAALLVAEGFDGDNDPADPPGRPTPASVVAAITEPGEFLGDIAADLDAADKRGLGLAVNLLDDLRLKWLGVVALRTASGDDLDALAYTFRNVAEDVFAVVFDEVESSDHNARLAEADAAATPLTLGNVWGHHRTMLTDNAALGVWLRIVSWDADHGGSGHITDETLRHITPERWSHTAAYLDDLTVDGLVEHVDGGWRLLERFDDGGGQR